jgi:Tfp pilus assembly protein PilN
MPDAHWQASAATIAETLSRLQLAERARLLSRLLAGVGTLALAVVSGGAFARYASIARRSDAFVTLEDAARATRAQLYELVRYVQQSNPDLVARVRDELARSAGASPVAAAGAGAS